jgi:hypothetical protein
MAMTEILKLFELALYLHLVIIFVAFLMAIDNTLGHIRWRNSNKKQKRGSKMTLENELEKLCVWKRVANHDIEKQFKKENYQTLNKQSVCFKCDGYDNNCFKYVPYSKIHK